MIQNKAAYMTNPIDIHTPIKSDDPANSSSAISVRGLSVRYGELLALDNVNVDIGWGTIVGVIGPNGAGKSTFLKAILGVVPHRDTALLIGGKPQAVGRKQIAYVPQREEVHWDFPVTVEDVALMGSYGRLGLLGRPSAKDRELAQWALEQVGMLDRRQTQIAQLSGGQQQRVFLARALVQQGKILILDEPLNGVDASTEETILHLLDDFRKSGGTVLMATHDLDIATRVSDDLCCINHTIIAFGPTAQVFTPQVLARTYGGKIMHTHGQHDIIIGENGSVGVNPQHVHEHPQLIPTVGTTEAKELVCRNKRPAFVNQVVLYPIPHPAFPFRGG